MWDFRNGRHWGDDAPLFYEDWSEEPGCEADIELVLGE